MLTIPNSVKTLFKSDETHKNIRIHFTNGERNDLTNEDVVAESVKFTESVCSQETFRFGTIEASVLEFETVGVENIYGATIEAGIEIDLSSLSAGQLQDIEDDPGDGVFVAEADGDLGYPYYRIPYGVFRVTSCPRNKESMTHRQITCMSQGADDIRDFPSWEKRKQQAPFDGIKYYRPTLEKLVVAMLANKAQETLSTFGFTQKTKVADWSTFTTGNNDVRTITIQSGGADYMYVNISTRRKDCYLARTNWPYDTKAELDHIFSIDIGKHGGADAYQYVLDAINSVPNITRIYSGDGEYKNADDAITNYLGKQFAPTVSFGGRSGVFPYVTQAEWMFTDDVPAIYPYVAAVRGTMLSVPYNSDITVHYYSDGSETTTRFNPSADMDNTIAVYYWTNPSPGVLSAYALRYEYTSNFYVSSIPANFYSFAGCFNIWNIVSAYLELLGLFGLPDRNGSIAIKELDDSSPISVLPESIESMWWDDYTVEDVGTVVASFTSGTENQTIEIDLYTGGSTYQLTDNAALLNANASESLVKTVITGGMARYFDKTGFAPAEITMQAWPWIEAGDALALEADDGTIVNTYALQHTITGIQNLKDEITATGGEIAEG